ATTGWAFSGTLEDITNMSEGPGVGSGRFCPEVRGWAALRLIACVPEPIREEIDRCALLPSAEGAHGRPSAAKDFVASAVGLVSHPASIAWSREVASRIPALGVAAGPACIARLLALRLLQPGSALQVYWPDIVDRVWSVISPALGKMGVPVQGYSREDLRHEVASPLALVFLKSLAAGRKDLRLLDAAPADRPDGPPFGWAPGIDAIGPVLRYLLADQVPGRFQSHAFMASPLARVTRAAGIAAPVAVVRWRCGACRTWATGEGACPHCGAALVPVRTRRLVATALLARGEDERLRRLRPRPSLEESCALTVCDRVEAEAAGRSCAARAGLVWERVVRGGPCNAPAMAVLAALAGLRPLTEIANRPAADPQRLRTLVEVLVDVRLDRVRLAGEVNLALASVARRLGQPVPEAVSAAYIGVLATRFRQAVFGPRGGRIGCGPCNVPARR
ncbi:MAG: hypothetical protein NT049_08175, partial [Planctomycetota bacterium]|nr:hypothetical protein [Planctomycetota bacterium]